MTPDGKILASNDDLHGKDAGLVFTPPADGDYVVRVRDLNNKGGDGFVYYLECDFARPDFTLKCDPSKAMIGPGSRTAWYVQVTRANGFAGPVKVEVQGTARGRDGQPADDPREHDAGLAGGVGRGGREDRRGDGEGGRHGGRDGRGGKPMTLTRGGRRWRRFTCPAAAAGRFDAGMQAVAVTDAVGPLRGEGEPEPRHAEAGRGSEDRRGGGPRPALRQGRDARRAAAAPRAASSATRCRRA